MTEHAELLPPPELIVENLIGIVGGGTIIADFVKIGEGIITNMRRAGILKAEHHVLDVGCGLGRLARPLVGFLNGEYHGFDINKSSIDWCVEHYKHIPNFHFRHADVYSTTYNRDAKTMDSDYRFPFGAAKFDFLWSTSLFTHMLVPGVENYLWEMARVMKRGGHCWNTYLLLDDFAERAAARMDAGSRWYLPWRVDGGRVRSADDTASQVALDQDRVLAIHHSCGLEIVDIRYGPWSGRKENVRAGGQDVIIARKI
jgi:cyclopropane fatty-acyl-phospholipid synthase-like methyltransferase